MSRSIPEDPRSEIRDGRAADPLRIPGLRSTRPRLSCPAVSYRIAVAVSGRGSNLRALGEALNADPDITIGAVIADRKAAALELARDHDWPAWQLVDHGEATEWLAILEHQAIDMLVLAGYLRLVPAPVIEAYRGRIINIHPALLPRHGGPGMYGRRVHAASSLGSRPSKLSKLPAERIS